MIEDKYIDMINADFDGELDATEVELLDQYLASSEEGKAYRDELVALGMKLKECFGESATPPADLRESIVTALLANHPGSATIDTAKVVKGKFSPVWLKPALALAASVLVAAFLFQLTPDSIGVDEGDGVTGSMVKSTLQESLEVDQPGLTAHIGLRRAQTTLILEIEVESETNTSTFIELPAARYERLPASVVDAGVVMTGNSLIVNSKGVFEINVVLKYRDEPGQVKAGRTIRVKFVQGDKVRHAGTLRIPPAE